MKRKDYVSFRMFMFADCTVLLRHHKSRRKNKKMRAYTKWYESGSNVVPINLDNIHMHSKRIEVPNYEKN